MGWACVWELGYRIGVAHICSHISQRTRTLKSSDFLMFRASNLVRRVSAKSPNPFNPQSSRDRGFSDFSVDSSRTYRSAPASSPSLSIWRRKKEMSKEGLIAAKELKRLQSNLFRLDRFIYSHVSRLLKSDLVSVLAEFQRQDQVFLCMKLYDVVRGEIWYRPDMFFYRDMLMMLARNKRVVEAKKVWEDLKGEGVLFDQHTFGDLVRAFLESDLPVDAMRIYEEMRGSPDPPLSLPFRVILKGLIAYPELRERVKDDFLELFPGMIVYDAPQDLCLEDEGATTESDLDS